jgi:hypothetical protein
MVHASVLTSTALVLQVAPVADASSSQSRADVVVIGLSAVLVLTGLQWLSLRPKPLVAVRPPARHTRLRVSESC